MERSFRGRDLKAFSTTCLAESDLSVCVIQCGIQPFVHKTTGIFCLQCLPGHTRQQNFATCTRCKVELHSRQHARTGRLIRSSWRLDDEYG